MILAVFLLFFSLLTSLADAQNLGEANHLFYRGNSAYKDGNFDSAISDYQKILALGLESGNVYYNLADSYFKKDDLGKAAFYYEKAMILMPGDSDLRSNYDFALSSLGISREFFGNRFYRFCAGLFDGVTVDSLAVILSIFYFLLVFVLVLNLYFSWAKILLKIALPIFAVFIFLSATGLSAKLAFLDKGAIVITGPVDVKFEPLDSATTFFKLNPGSRVEVLDEVPDWTKVRRPDGKIGWVPAANIDHL